MMIPEGESSCASNTKLVSAAHPRPVQIFVSFSLLFISLSAFQEGAGAHFSQELLRTGSRRDECASLSTPSLTRLPSSSFEVSSGWSHDRESLKSHQSIDLVKMQNQKCKSHCTEENPEFSRGCSIPWVHLDVATSQLSTHCPAEMMGLGWWNRKPNRKHCWVRFPIHTFN